MAEKKAVLQLSVHEERIRKKVFVTVSRFSGVISITMDDKTGKMTVVGELDVSVIVMKLRKICNAEIVSVEPVKPPEKKPEPAKPAPPKPTEIVPIPVMPLNYPHQYQYANYYHHPNEPDTCVIM